MYHKAKYKRLFAVLLAAITVCTQTEGGVLRVQAADWSVEAAIQNPGFETTSGDIAWTWDTGFSFYTGTDADKVRSGSGSLHFSAPDAQATELAEIHLTQDVWLEANDASEYTISGHVFGAGLGNIAIAVSTVRESWKSYRYDNLRAEEWNHICTENFIVSESGIYTLSITLWLSAGNEGYLDDFSLSETVDDDVIHEAWERLSALIDQAHNEDLTNRTQESIAAFNEALAAAEAVLADNEARTAALSEAYDNLENAINGLQDIPADITEARAELDRLIKEAETFSDHSGDYTAESYQAMLDALDEARTVLDDPNATLDALNGAADNLRSTIDGLETVTPDPERTVTDVAIADKTTDVYRLLNSELTIDQGKPLDLSDIKAVITWSDGTTAQMPISWDEDARTHDGQIQTTGTYLIHGELQIDGVVYPLVLTVVVNGVDASVYTLRTVTDKKRGSISLSTWEALYGEEISVLLLPVDGYKIAGLTISGAETAEPRELPVRDNHCTFSMPDEDITLEATWDVLDAKIPLDDCDIRLEPEVLQYIGKPLEPAVIATYDNGAVTLQKNRDYTVTYSNNTNGRNAYATATIKGKGRFTGTVTRTFHIVSAISIAGASVKSIPSQEYTGSPICPVPEVTVKDDNGNKITLQQGDFTLAYENNQQVGTASVTIIGAGNYTGSKVINFRIVRRDISKHLNIAGDSMSADIPDDGGLIFTGKALTPAVVIQDGDRILESGKDYKVSYKNNVNASSDSKGASVTITGAGSYTGKATLPFSIAPRPVTDDAVKIHVGAVTTGGLFVKYPSVQLELNGKVYPAKGNYETRPVAGTTAAPGKKELQVQGIGNFDQVATIPYFVTSKENQLTSMKVSGATAQTWRCGEAVTLPMLTFTNRANENFTEYYTDPTGKVTRDFSVEYKNNTGVGTATACVTGLTEECAGYREIKFRITPIKLSSALAESAVTAAPVGDDALFGTDFYATGYAVTPAFSVNYIGADPDNPVSLTPGTDYRVTYAKNVKAGTASATIKGIGNYSFTKKAAFDILALEDDKLRITVPTVSYTGKKITPAIRFTYQGKEISLKNKTAYTVSYRNNLNVASAAQENAPTIRLTPKLWKGSVRNESFSIHPAKLSDDGVTTKTLKYSGKSLTPLVRVLCNGRVLKAGRDYTAQLNIRSSDDYSILGWQTVTVTGIGNYRGTVTKTVLIR